MESACAPQRCFSPQNMRDWCNELLSRAGSRGTDNGWGVMGIERRCGMNVGMEEKGKPFQAIDESGSGSAEVGVAVDPIDAALAHGGELLVSRICLKDRAILLSAGDIEAATGNDQHFGIGGDDFLPA